MFKKIETLPKELRHSRKMFLAIAKDVVPFDGYNGAPYTTDPYCVWWEGNDQYARWPHQFPPTHFMLIPEQYE